MRKFIIFLLTVVIICTPVCGCAAADTQKELVGTTIRNEITPVVVTQSSLVDADVMKDPFIIDEVNYMAIMRECCLTGNVEQGRIAENERNNKIDTYNLSCPKISFNDLYELSKVITAEAGSSWIPLDWKMMVGEVVLNRVASPEFPDTVTEVIHQRGQYSGANTKYFENLVPFEDCIEAASKLLSGERLINDASVVFQSNHRQGSGTYRELYDSYYGYTYLCYSEHPELY